MLRRASRPRLCYMRRVEMEATSVREGNLGERGQSARLLLGVVLFGVALTLAVVALELHAPRAVLALLAIPFFAATHAIMMGLYRT
ncbi:MAG TPA: hypothetical protein VHB21_25915 [Minicystis sp.]|nr:hypothetical protein [Minicystis sp.]